MAEFLREDVLHLSLQWSFADTLASYGTYWGISGGSGSKQDAAIECAAGIGGALALASLPMQSDECVFRHGYCHGELKDRYTAGNFQGGGLQGSVASNALPPSNAALFLERSNDIPASINNRLYFPGVPESGSSGSAFDPTYAQADWDAWIAYIGSPQTPPSQPYTFHPVVKTTSAAAGATPLAPRYFTVSTVVAQPLLAQMRPRKRRSKGVEQTGN